ncbi:MAG: hypothetical protein AAGA18_03575 [Verrucomicrobiota bacterium]
MNNLNHSYSKDAFLSLLLITTGLIFLLNPHTSWSLGKKANEEAIDLDRDNISIRYEEEQAFITYTLPYAKGDVLFSTKVILGRKKKDGEMSRLTFQYQAIVNVSTTNFDQKQNYNITWNLPAKELEYYRHIKLDTYIRNLQPIKLTADHIKTISQWNGSAVEMTP